MPVYVSTDINGKKVYIRQVNVEKLSSLVPSKLHTKINNSQESNSS